MRAGETITDPADRRTTLFSASILGSSNFVIIGFVASAIVPILQAWKSERYTPTVFILGRWCRCGHPAISSRQILTGCDRRWSCEFGAAAPDCRRKIYPASSPKPYAECPGP